MNSELKITETQLHQVLQAGILFPLDQTCTVQQFLQGQLQLSWEFIEGKLQTIMLNSKVVDDLDHIWLQPCSRLALSGPMPGLVGASLRRHSCLARLREGISMPEPENKAADHSKEANSKEANSKETTTLASAKVTPRLPEPFTFELRVYNSVLKDLGYILLQKGFWAKQNRLAQFKDGSVSLPDTSFVWVQA